MIVMQSQSLSWNWIFESVIDILYGINKLEYPVKICLQYSKLTNCTIISCHVWIKLMGQSGQISTVHQKLVTFWNITHMMIWNSLVEPFGVKYERPNLGQARLYIDRILWPLFSGCHALTFSGFLRFWTRKIIKFLLFLF